MGCQWDDNVFARFLLPVKVFCIPLLYNAILLVNAGLADPFNGEVNDFPFKKYELGIEGDGLSYVQAGEHLPAWMKKQKWELMSGGPLGSFIWRLVQFFCRFYQVFSQRRPTAEGTKISWPLYWKRLTSRKSPIFQDHLDQKCLRPIVVLHVQQLKYSQRHLPRQGVWFREFKCEQRQVDRIDGPVQRCERVLSLRSGRTGRTGLVFDLFWTLLPCNACTYNSAISCRSLPTLCGL